MPREATALPARGDLRCAENRVRIRTRFFPVRAARRIGTTQHVDEREPWPNQTLEALLSPV